MKISDMLLKHLGGARDRPLDAPFHGLAEYEQFVGTEVERLESDLQQQTWAEIREKSDAFRLEALAEANPNVRSLIERVRVIALRTSTGTTQALPSEYTAVIDLRLLQFLIIMTNALLLYPENDPAEPSRSLTWGFLAYASRIAPIGNLRGAHYQPRFPRTKTDASGLYSLLVEGYEVFILAHELAHIILHHGGLLTFERASRELSEYKSVQGLLAIDQSCRDELFADAIALEMVSRLAPMPDIDPLLASVVLMFSLVVVAHAVAGEHSGGRPVSARRDLWSVRRLLLEERLQRDYGLDHCPLMHAFQRITIERLWPAGLTARRAFVLASRETTLERPNPADQVGAGPG